MLPGRMLGAKGEKSFEWFFRDPFHQQEYH